MDLTAKQKKFMKNPVPSIKKAILKVMREKIKTKSSKKGKGTSQMLDEVHTTTTKPLIDRKTTYTKHAQKKDIDILEGERSKLMGVQNIRKTWKGYTKWQDMDPTNVYTTQLLFLPQQRPMSYSDWKKMSLDQLIQGNRVAYNLTVKPQPARVPKGPSMYPFR